jgi:hypothetical protein
MIMTSTKTSDLDSDVSTAEAKLLYSTPDSDRDVRFQLHANLANRTQETIEYIKSNAVIINSDSLPIVVSEDENETFIPPNASDKITIWLNYGKESLMGAGSNGIKARVQLLCCRADFIELPPIVIAAQAQQVVGTKKKVNLNGQVEVVNAAAWFQEKDEDDGTSTVQCYVTVRNLTDCHISKCEVKMRLLDSRGRTLDTSESAESVPVGGFTAIDCSIWSARYAQLTAGCILQVGVTVYSTVEIHDIVSDKGELSKDF